MPAGVEDDRGYFTVDRRAPTEQYLLSFQAGVDQIESVAVGWKAVERG